MGYPHVVGKVSPLGGREKKNSRWKALRLPLHFHREYQIPSIEIHTPCCCGGPLRSEKCVGIQNELLEKFWEGKYGMVCLNDDGFAIGGRLVTKKPQIFHCAGVPRSAQSIRCDQCFALHNIYQCARTRSVQSEENGTQKFTPLASVRASPLAKKLLEDFYQENKALKEELKILKAIEEGWIGC